MLFHHFRVLVIGITSCPNNLPGITFKFEKLIHIYNNHSVVHVYFELIGTDISRQSVGIHTAKRCIQHHSVHVCPMHKIKLLCIYAVTVGVHKCGVVPSHYSGQSVHRLNTPSKESQ